MNPENGEPSRPVSAPALLLPEVRSSVAPAASPTVAAPAPRNQKEKRALHLITLLNSCAADIAEGKMELANKGLEKICSHASEDGGCPSLHRVASSFADAMALRMVQPWQGVCRALRLQKTTPAPADNAARHLFTVMCPFLRLAGTAATHAIINAADTERNAVLHVVDLGGSEPGQWLLLLQLFASRRRDQILRLTIVNEDEEFLSSTAALLVREAARLKVGFEFHPVKLHINQLLNVEPLDVRSGEALAIVSTLQLHLLLAEESAAEGQAHATMTRADALLRDLAKLSPKLMVVTEQEADHNGTDFKDRFWNALSYYAALFDALAESVPARGSAVERACVERRLLQEEIRDVVAYEGAHRRERHEPMERWAARMAAAGFAPVMMSSDAMEQAMMMTQMQLVGVSNAYKVSIKNSGCLIIYWHNVPLFSVSTWRAV